PWPSVRYHNKPSQTALATGYSCVPSWRDGQVGSIPHCPKVLSPSKYPSSPRIEIGNHDGEQKHLNFPEDDVPKRRREDGALLVGCRPRIEKQKFQVEDEEENRNQIKFH